MSIINNIVFDYLSKYPGDFCVTSTYHKETHHRHVDYKDMIEWFMNTPATYAAQIIVAMRPRPRYRSATAAEYHHVLMVLFDAKYWDLLRTDKLIVIPYTLCGKLTYEKTR